VENLIIQSLSQSVSQDDVNVTDPILPLIGTLSFKASDLGENHDRYLNQALQKEIKLADNVFIDTSG
jgi:hypothetical protein